MAEVGIYVTEGPEIHGLRFHTGNMRWPAMTRAPVDGVGAPLITKAHVRDARNVPPGKIALPESRGGPFRWYFQVFWPLLTEDPLAWVAAHAPVGMWWSANFPGVQVVSLPLGHRFRRAAC